METLPPLPNQPKPIDPSPQVINAPTSFGVTPTVIKPRRGLKILLVLGLISLVLLGGAGSVAAAVAYDKLTINNPGLEDQIRHTVLAIPFLPKTPRYVLERTLLAAEQIKSASVDLSFVAESASIQSQLGLSTIDASLKGQFDISNPKNRQADVEVSLTKDLSLNMKVKDNIGYLKINKLPDMVYTILKTDAATVEPLLSDWISWDLSTLDTEARKKLETSSADRTKENQARVKELLQDERIAKSLVLSDDTINGFPVYKVKLSTTPETLNLIGRKLEQLDQSNNPLSENLYSEYIQQFDIEALIDKRSFNTRQISVTMNTKAVTLPSFPASSTTVLGESADVLGTTLTALGEGNVQMVWSILFDKFNEPITVVVPEKSISFPEFYAKLQPVVTNMYSNQMQTAQDSKRKADIDVLARIVDIYKTQNGRYPLTLSATTNLMASGEVPTDPATGEEYFYKPNSARTGFVMRATLSNGVEYTYTEAGYLP